MRRPMFPRPARLLVRALSFARPAGADPTAQQLAERLDLVRRPTTSFEVTLGITEMKDGKVTQESQHHVMARKVPDGGRFDAVSRCIAPDADRGKSILTVGRDLWFFDPKSKRPTQLSLGHFHGRFFIADVLSASLSDDYDCDLDGEETIKDAGKNDVPCLRLKMKRRDKKGLTPDVMVY